MSQVHGKFFFSSFRFFIYLQLYLLQCKHGLETRLESNNRIDGMDREGKGEGKREETKEMGTTGNRGLEMHLHFEPSVCFFFLSLYLFLLTLTYRLLQQPRTATMSHTTHWPPTDHQQPTTNLHHSPHPVPRRDTGTTTTILPPSHSINDHSAHWVWQRDRDGYGSTKNGWRARGQQGAKMMFVVLALGSRHILSP